MISKIIEEVCQQYNIPYKSKHRIKNLPDKDIHSLVEIYFSLMKNIKLLALIENNHPSIKGFKDTIQQAVIQLEKIDHKVLKEALILSKGRK